MRSCTHAQCPINLALSALQWPVHSDIATLSLSLCVAVLLLYRYLMWKEERIAPDDLWVKLSLTVCAAGADGQPVGLNVDDCGECQFCLDKTKFGGPGTKRQKCILKKSISFGHPQAWASLKVCSKRHLEAIEEYSQGPPPQALIDADNSQPGGIPVWAFLASAARAL